MRPVFRRVLAIGLVFGLAGCQSYEPAPLQAAESVAAVERARLDPRRAGSGGISAMDADAAPASLAQLAAWMIQQGPDVRVAVAAFETAWARARIATPLPNPAVEFGIESAFGSSIGKDQAAPFGALGITIPLGSARAATDAWNLARAEALRVDGLARCRELYFDLRAGFVSLALQSEIRRAQVELAKAAERSEALVRRMSEAGQATAIDAVLAAIERGRARAAVLDARLAAANALGDLAAMVGVHADRIDAVSMQSMPALPATIPAAPELRDSLIQHHPQLARLRARYEEAEGALRLEVARQYPALHFGPTLAGETGENKTSLGLSVGIDLPIFDRNQQGIAEARAAREELRVRFEAAASRALAQLDRARAGLALAKARRQNFDEGLVPEARRNVDLVRRGLSAGSSDSLGLLDAQRGQREIELASLQAQLAEYSAWIDLERAVGRPLLEFPGSAEFSGPGELEQPLVEPSAPDQGTKGAEQ